MSATRHETHHRLIAERRDAWERAPRRSGLDKIRRRELDKKATWTLAGHLRGEHRIAPGRSYAAMAEAHERAHAEPVR